MKKLFLNIAILGFLALSTVWLLSRRGDISYNDYNYLAAIIDKNNLLDTVKSPRIIFVGASNIAFGIDSEEIEDAFHIPVINMGLHGNLGFDFILNEVKYNLKKGDIIILAIEFYLDEFDYPTISYLLNVYPQAEQYVERDAYYYKEKLKFEFAKAQLARKRLFNIFFGKILNLKEAKLIAESDLNLFDTTIYSRNKFNSNGDVISHLDKPSLKDIRGRIQIARKDYSGRIDKMNEFAEFSESKGAKVFYTYPCYPETEFIRNKGPIMDLDKKLSRELKMPVIASPTEFIFPDSLFFDTVYHLNKEGRELRTIRMIEILKEKVFNAKN
ncbi:MAG: hypothetical protein ABIY50_10695 [Ignavibacteria bacterium]